MKYPNILIITADDMNCDSVGVFGCPVPDVTPNLDRLASEGIRFEHAHVSVAVCQPSRSSLMTGRYPHRCGGEGFYHLRQPDVPMLTQILGDNQAGKYVTGIIGKLTHARAYAQSVLDMALDGEDIHHGRSPQAWAKHVGRFLNQADDADQPFCLICNLQDPHRPFSGSEDEAKRFAPEVRSTFASPSATFSPDEVTVPGFLPDLPAIRAEVAEYYASCRRCDDCVGAILAQLHDAGLTEQTLVVFLSDHGMSFPFAKTSCYRQSTRTPLILRWSGVIQAGQVDRQHMVSTIDLLPTLLEATGMQVPRDIDGRSFMPLLGGQTQDERDYVFTQFHQNKGRRNYPMRAIQDRDFLYIWNPWSDGHRAFHNESMHGLTFAAMQDAARTDPAVAARVQLYLWRVPEELYDLTADPDALNNLMGDSAFARQRERLCAELARWMRATDDPALHAFENRDEPAIVSEFLRDNEKALDAKPTEFTGIRRWWMRFKNARRNRC